jgi:hypothetical protein
VFLYGFVLIMGRLAAPWQLIRIATRAAETDEAARIAETPYGRAVTMVLGEVECMVNDLRSELKAHRPVTSLLKNIHDAARGLRTEIDLSGDSPWSRQLTAIRTEVSNVLRGEIESTPGAGYAACCGRVPPRRSCPARSSMKPTWLRPS